MRRLWLFLTRLVLRLTGRVDFDRLAASTLALFVNLKQLAEVSNEFGAPVRRELCGRWIELAMQVAVEFKQVEARFPGQGGNPGWATGGAVETLSVDELLAHTFRSTADGVRAVCLNPECWDEFVPNSPRQLYCGTAECDRSRARRRKALSRRRRSTAELESDRQESVSPGGTTWLYS